MQQFALNIKISRVQNAPGVCLGGKTFARSPDVTDLSSQTRYEVNKGLGRTSDMLTPTPPAKKPPGEEEERKSTLTGLRLCDQQKGREKRYLVRE